MIACHMLRDFRLTWSRELDLAAVDANFDHMLREYCGRLDAIKAIPGRSEVRRVRSNHYRLICHVADVFLVVKDLWSSKRPGEGLAAR